MNANRRLAAIAANGDVGHSRLMGDDETGWPGNVGNPHAVG
jgi:hypothetical protein